MTEAEADAGRVEQRRPFYEFFRHLMTPHGAALVLVATLIERVFVHSVARAAIVVAVLGFLGSLFAGGYAYLVAVASHPRIGATRMSSVDKREFAMSAALTLIGFLFGVGGVTWFFLANWLA